MTIRILWSNGSYRAGGPGIDVVDRPDENRDYVRLGELMAGKHDILPSHGTDYLTYIDIPVEQLEEVITALRYEAAGPLGKALMDAERVQQKGACDATT